MTTNSTNDTTSTSNETQLSDAARDVIERLDAYHEATLDHSRAEFGDFGYLNLYVIPSPDLDNPECHVFILDDDEHLHYVLSFDVTNFDDGVPSVLFGCDAAGSAES